MTPYYFTFGVNTPRKNKYMKIYAENENAARAEMISKFGNQWAFCYPEYEFLMQIEEYGLTELTHHG